MEEKLSPAETEVLQQYEQRVSELQKKEASLLTRISFLQNAWRKSLSYLSANPTSPCSSFILSKAYLPVAENTIEEMHVPPFEKYYSGSENEEKGKRKEELKEANSTDVELVLPSILTPRNLVSDEKLNRVLLPRDGLTLSNQQRYALISQEFKEALSGEDDGEEKGKSPEPFNAFIHNADNAVSAAGHEKASATLTVEEVRIMQNNKRLRNDSPSLLSASSLSFSQRCEQEPLRTASCNSFVSSPSRSSSLTPTRMPPASNTTALRESIRRSLQQESWDCSLQKEEASVRSVKDAEGASQTAAASSSSSPLSSQNSSLEMENHFCEMNKAFLKKHQLKRRRTDTNLRAQLLSLQFVRSFSDAKKRNENEEVDEEIAPAPTISVDDGTSTAVAPPFTSSSTSSFFSSSPVSVVELLSVLDPVKEKGGRLRHPLSNLKKAQVSMIKKKKMNRRRESEEEWREAEEIEESTAVPPIGIPLILLANAQTSHRIHSPPFQPRASVEIGNNCEGNEGHSRDKKCDDYSTMRSGGEDNAAIHAEKLSNISWGSDRFADMKSYARSRGRRLEKIRKTQAVRMNNTRADSAKQHVSLCRRKEEREPCYFEGTDSVEVFTTKLREKNEGNRLYSHVDPPLNETPPEFWAIDFPSFLLAGDAKAESRQEP